MVMLAGAYVPTAILIASPSAAFPIAPLIVRQGEAGELQEFRSLPPEATNQIAFVNAKLTEPGKPVTMAITL